MAHDVSYRPSLLSPLQLLLLPLLLSLVIAVSDTCRLTVNLINTNYGNRTLDSFWLQRYSFRPLLVPTLAGQSRPAILRPSQSMQKAMRPVKITADDDIFFLTFIVRYSAALFNNKHKI